MKETNSYKIYVNGYVDYSNIPKTALEPLTKKVLEAILQQLKDVQEK